MGRDRFRVSNKVCLFEDNHVLLLKNHADVWELPGGHLEISDGDVEGALQREVAEETSLLLDSYELVRLHKYDDRFALFWRSTEWAGSVGISAEHLAFAWVDTSELDDYVLTWPGLRGLIRGWV